MAHPKQDTALQYQDNKGVNGKQGAYRVHDVNVREVLKSWKFSLFSFEWLTPEGAIRNIQDLPALEQKKYQAVLADIAAGEKLERPILGIGMMDNVEIGSRRDVFLSLAHLGYESVSVHLPINALDDFTPYL